MKGANLLINKKGELKLADFGLGRWINTHNRNLTQEVVTFPYRAPEITFGYKQYDEKIDIWSVGCIFAELLLGNVLFTQKDNMEQMQFMYQLLGDPRVRWPEVQRQVYWDQLKPRMNFENNLKNYVRQFRRDLSDEGADLLQRFFDYNPHSRISAKEALEHQFFKESPYSEENAKMLASYNGDMEYHEFSQEIVKRKRKIEGGFLEEEEEREK